MFGIKSLLKISFLFLIIVIISSCKPLLIPEEIKETGGYYAYDKGDTIDMYIVKENKVDTFVFILSKKDFFISKTNVRGFEWGNISFVDTKNNCFLISFEDYSVFVLSICINSDKKDLSHL